MFKKITYSATLFIALVLTTASPNSALSQNNGKTTEDQFKLNAYPNPSASSINVSYSLPENTTVKLMIYSVDGSVGKVLFAGTKQAGEYNETYDISSLAPGNYFYQLQTETDMVTKTITMISGSTKQN